jgi:hypothetical protein
MLSAKGAHNAKLDKIRKQTYISVVLCVIYYTENHRVLKIRAD